MVTDMDAPQYTMLIFGFPSLCTLRQYSRDKNATNVYNNLLLLYILIVTIPYVIHKYTLIFLLPIFPMYKEFLLF